MPHFSLQSSPCTIPRALEHEHASSKPLAHSSLVMGQLFSVNFLPSNYTLNSSCVGVLVQSHMFPQHYHFLRAVMNVTFKPNVGHRL